eukprot:1159438-Pelagomonas_calceolata.AAC.2
MQSMFSEHLLVSIAVNPTSNRTFKSGVHQNCGDRARSVPDIQRQLHPVCQHEDATLDEIPLYEALEDLHGFPFTGTYMVALSTRICIDPHAQRIDARPDCSAFAPKRTFSQASTPCNMCVPPPCMCLQKGSTSRPKCKAVKASVSSCIGTMPHVCPSPVRVPECELSTSKPECKDAAEHGLCANCKLSAHVCPSCACARLLPSMASVQFAS